METSDAISLVATVLALVALTVSISEALANRPRLRLKYSYAMGVGGMTGEWIVISATNWGRQATTIDSVSIEFPGLRGADGQSKHTPHIPQMQNGIAVGKQCPFLLEVGHAADFHFPLAPREIEDEEGTLQTLIKRYGATARITTSWHRKPLRLSISKAER